MNTDAGVRRLDVRGTAVSVVRKPIKHLHLGVYPPDGRVRVAAPPHVDDDAVRLAVVMRLEPARAAGGSPRSGNRARSRGGPPMKLLTFASEHVYSIARAAAGFLDRRLMRHPCSFLIYSKAFDALPAPAKNAIHRRLWSVLSGAEAGPPYDRLSRADRRAIVEILLDTKPGLPDYFRPVER